MQLLPRIYTEINNNLSYFSISKNFDADTNKRFSELSIFFELTSNVDCLENSEKHETLKKFFISEILNIPENSIFKNIYNSYHITVPYVSIRKYHKIERFEKYLKIIAKNKLFPPETPPHRAMEWDYLLYKIGKKQEVEIPQLSILCQDFHPQFFDREITYTLTHALFYLTDFGFSGYMAPVINIEKLKFQLEILIAQFYDKKDIDVLLELAINYFSLFTHTSLNYEIIEIINHALLKASFIEFNWTKEVLVKKYHTFLLLGILSALFENHISNKRINFAKRETLLSKIKNTVFENAEGGKIPQGKDSYIHSLPVIQAWDLLNKTKYKDFDIDFYRNYIEKYGHNPFLTKSILSLLKIFKQRNDLNILWTQEFKELNTTKGGQEKLKNDYAIKIEGDIKSLSSLIEG